MRLSIFVVVAVIASLVMPASGSEGLFARPSVAQAASTQTYVVLYTQQAISASSRDAIRQAGGTLIYAYDQIGVAIASSASATFRDDVTRLDRAVEGAAATAAFATKLRDVSDADGPQSGDLPNSPATDADTFSAFQWDMQQIKTPQAHAITGGSRSVLVGDIDTGLDYRHPERRRCQQRELPDRRAGAGDGRGGRRRRPRHPHRRHDRRGRERHRDRRRCPERPHRGHQGGQLGRLLLRASGDLRLLLGGHAPLRRDEQQLFRGPVVLQLQERPGTAGDLEGRGASDPLRAAAGRHGRRGAGELRGRPRTPDPGHHQPRHRARRRPNGPQRLRGDPGRDPRRHRGERDRIAPAQDLLLELRRRRHAGRRARRR